MVGAFFASDHSPPIRILLTKLASYGQRDGTECRPAIPTLARASGICERSVRDHLPSMENLGFIVRTGTRGGVAVYTVPLGEIPAHVNRLTARCALLHRLKPLQSVIFTEIAATAGNGGRTGDRCPTADDLGGGFFPETTARKVSRAIRELIDMGLLRQKQRGCRGRQAAWDVVWSPEAQAWIQVHAQHGEGAKSSTIPESECVPPAKSSSISDTECRTIFPECRTILQGKQDDFAGDQDPNIKTSNQTPFGVAAALRSAALSATHEEAVRMADRAIEALTDRVEQLRDLQFNAGKNRQGQIRAAWRELKEVRAIRASLQPPEQSAAADNGRQKMGVAALPPLEIPERLAAAIAAEQGAHEPAEPHSDEAGRAVESSGPTNPVPYASAAKNRDVAERDAETATAPRTGKAPRQSAGWTGTPASRSQKRPVRGPAKHLTGDALKEARRRAAIRGDAALKLADGHAPGWTDEELTGAAFQHGAVEEAEAIGADWRQVAGVPTAKISEAQFRELMAAQLGELLDCATDAKAKAREKARILKMLVNGRMKRFRAPGGGFYPPPG